MEFTAANVIPLVKKKASKNDNNYNQFAFALEILRLLSEKPLRRQDLGLLLSDFLEERGKSAEDIHQKISRTVSKLRECGIEIRSAPNRPYELVSSSLPVILSEEQRQALALAAHFLTDMGFSAQAGHLSQIGKLEQFNLPAGVNVNFSPPIDYSEARVEDIVQTLQERFRQRRRYTIRYCSSRGNQQNRDLDRSELRLHNGVLYLFAYVPDFAPRYVLERPSVEQNQAFRVDRILSIRAASDIPWGILRFPTLEVHYRMSGPLGTYQPRRVNERERLRDREANVVEIVAQEDSLFWFRQRILQYGENVQILKPIWLATQIAAELKRAHQNYGDRGSTK